MLDADAVAFVHRLHGHEVTFVGVASRGTANEFLTFVEDQWWVAEFPHLADPNGDLWDRFGVVSNPSMVLIDRNGDWDLYIGRHRLESLQRRVSELV